MSKPLRDVCRRCGKPAPGRVTPKNVRPICSECYNRVNWRLSINESLNELSKKGFTFPDRDVSVPGEPDPYTGKANH